MKLLLFFLPIILFSQTYYYNIPCDDNAANTVVVNSGTSGTNWVANANTDVIHNVSNLGFDLRGNYYIVSTDSVTFNKFRLTFKARFERETETSSRYFFQVGDGDNGNDANEWHLFRHNTIGENFWFRAVDADNNGYELKTTDMNVNTTTQYTFVLTVDASVSPWLVSLTIDGTSLTFGSWEGGNPPVTTFNNKMWCSTSNTVEPDAYIRDILLENLLLSSEIIGKNKFNSYNSYSNWEK